MRMNDLTRRLDRYVDFDAIGERIDALTDRLANLRDHLPESPMRKVRNRLPSYRDVRARLPYAPRERNYTLPAAIAAGGIAILGAIVVTAYLARDAHRVTPKSNNDMH